MGTLTPCLGVYLTSHKSTEKSPFLDNCIFGSTGCSHFLAWQPVSLKQQLTSPSYLPKC